MRVRIAPSVLAADLSDLGRQVKEAAAGGADMIHFDIMDGHFVPNITFGPQVVASARKWAETPFVIHLMIENPGDYVEEFARAGADYITVHAEATVHLERVVEQIRNMGKCPGVALNPATPLSAVEWVLDEIDLLLIMTVNPGFGGQQFIPVGLRKIAQARRLIDERGLPVLVEVDGGINIVTAPQVVRAGAEVLVAGTAVYQQPKGIAAALQALRAVAEAEKAIS